MSEEVYGQRFKRVENFFRRIAFNLGNTPSQTEVKVISCIPIDVTDLQHKITVLEQQLEAANAKQKEKQECKKEGKKEDKKDISTLPTFFSNTYTNRNISCCCPSCSMINVPTSCRSTTNVPTCSPGHKPSKLPKASSPQICLCCSSDVSSMDRKDKCCRTNYRRHIFGKKKKKNCKKKKVRTQMVYYTHTEDINPFNNLGDAGTSKDGWREGSNIFNGPYMTNIVRKQYAPCPLIERNSASEFSTPVCRDVTTVRESLQRSCGPHDPDEGSSCCSQFQNIDNKINRCDLFSLRTDSSNAYYDSNFYDVVPVKEHTTKSKREYPNKKEIRNNMDVLYWPKTVRRSCESPQVICHSMASPRIRKVPMKPQNRKDIKVLNKRPKINSTLCKKNVKIRKTHAKTRGDSFECKSIQTKQSRNTKHKLMNHVNITTDAACLAIPITDTECQTISVNNTNGNEIKDITETLNSAECKTEVTLNQIKNILQTVLNEVKTNSKKNIPIQMKKDATVQNGPSQSYMNKASSLIKSFTYSPYNLSPYSDASCSKHTPNNSFWDVNIPQGPIKCLHYPLFVQPDKGMCTSCYRHYPQVNIPRMKCATSTATNTQKIHLRSRETEGLIKEIYKSLALHVTMPTKDTIVSHDDIKKSIRNFNTKVEDREAKSVAKAISEIFKNQIPSDISSVTQTVTPLESKLVSDKCRLKKYKPSANNDVLLKNDEKTETEQMSPRLGSDNNYDDDDYDDDEYNDVKDVGHGDNDIGQNEDSESSVVSEPESDDVVIVKRPRIKQDKKKTGFFSKMLKIFQPRTRNQQKKVIIEEKKLSPTDIDSDQTVYSDHTSLTQTRQSDHAKAICYSKLPKKLKEQPHDRLKPQNLQLANSEQERKKYPNYNEKHASKDQRTLTINTILPKNLPFYQRVEARNAYVGNRGPIYETTQTQTQTQTQKQTKINPRNHCEETGLHFHVPVKEPKAPKAEKNVEKNPKSWMKKHRPTLKCGPAWRKLIVEG